MLTQNNHATITHQPSDSELVELALSGKFPGLLANLLAPDLANNIYHNIEGNSKNTCHHIQ